MFRRFVASFLIVMLLISTTSCADTKVIDEIEYDHYGLLNQSDKQNPNIEYEVVWGNIFWGIVLIETIIAPIYFFGFALFEPVSSKPDIKGQVPGSLQHHPDTKTR